MKKKKTPRTLTRIALKKAKKEFIYRAITALISRSLLMTIPILFGLAVGHISEENFRAAYFMAIALIIVFVLFRVFEVVNTYFWHKLFNKLYQELTREGLQNTHDNSLFSLSRIDTGEYLNIMHNDLNVICMFYCNLSIRVIRVFEFFVIIAYFFITNMFFGFAGVGVSLLAFFILYLSSKKIQHLNKKRAYALDHRNSIINEILLSIKEIKSFNIFRPIQSRVMKSSDHFADVWLTQRVVEDSYRFGIVLLIEIFRLLLFIYGIYLITQGSMEVGVLVIIYNYYGQLIDNFNDFATINVDYRNLRVSEDRFNKLLEHSRSAHKTETDLNEYQGNITFENILYGYRHAPVLNDVSFNINNNEITCITGPSGSGKSGIVDLLLKLNRQHTGNVLLDGHNINDIDSDEYFNLISLTTDEPVFFSMSIKENLSIIDSNMKKIIKVCKELGIHEYISKLPEGYDTVLTANGSNIDQRTKYLISIAKNLIKDSRILIFDESFDTLAKKDIENIMNILKAKKEDHTIIIFTKDESILKQSDQVILINDHKVLSTGKHKTLIKENEVYKEIVLK